MKRKATLRFSDGVEFDTDGSLRLEHAHDGWYVVGEGNLIPVDSIKEGRRLIEVMRTAKK